MNRRQTAHVSAAALAALLAAGVLGGCARRASLSWAQVAPTIQPAPVEAVTPAAATHPGPGAELVAADTDEGAPADVVVR